MTDKTNIEWCDSTFNPWIGCTKVSPACDHCYAENLMDTRLRRVEWGAGKPRRRTSDQNWNKVRRWNAEPFSECMSCGWRGERRECKTVANPPGFNPPVRSALTCPKCNEPTIKKARRRVFCASLADWLDNEVPIEWLVDLLDVIRQTPNLDWLLLTKRIGNFDNRLTAAADHVHKGRLLTSRGTDEDLALLEWIDLWHERSGPSNVWLGATVVNQAEADRDIPKLLATPAVVRWISVEPMLGPIDLEPVLTVGIIAPKDPVNDGRTLDWVVCGGESGAGARPMHPEWVQTLRDQCDAAAVPFLLKQWGEWTPWNNAPLREGINLSGAGIDKRVHVDPTTGATRGNPHLPPEYTMYRVGKKAAGRTLDGRTWSQWPEVPA